MKFNTFIIRLTDSASIRPRCRSAAVNARTPFISSRRCSCSPLIVSQIRNSSDQKYVYAPDGDEFDVLRKKWQPQESLVGCTPGFLGPHAKTSFWYSKAYICAAFLEFWSGGVFSNDEIANETVLMYGTKFAKLWFLSALIWIIQAYRSWICGYTHVRSP